LTIERLAREGGIEIHGCGIDAGGRGIVFAGESGAGKSTLARLLSADAGVQVLSDDRVVVRERAGEYRLYGTPWHGEARFGAPGGVALERILFLRHGAGNAVRRLAGGQAVKELLRAAFLPFWDAGGMAAALDFMEGLVTRVPCAEFSFVPDRSAVDFALSRSAYQTAKTDVQP
jgi:hypothetical protein